MSSLSTLFLATPMKFTPSIAITTLLLFFWETLCLPKNVKPKLASRAKKFYINGKPTFKGRTWNGYEIEGLLPNSRMVQGIFDDRNPDTRAQWAYPDTQSGMQTAIPMSL
ncbi:MAG: hypothetical protein R2822_18810 [Spirosomataceae bacterium]